jgi:hypothetical protein
LAESRYTQLQKATVRYPLESGRSSGVNFNVLKDRFRPLADIQ